MSKAYHVVRDFEAAMCEYTGAPCAVAVDSCSSALFLACQRRLCFENYFGEIHSGSVQIPRYTYPSVAAAIYHAGRKVRFRDQDWQRRGYYDLSPTQIIDSAKYLTRGMWRMMVAEFDSPLVCLSFHAKKTLPIGHGGMILCPTADDAAWFKRARFDGRNEAPLEGDTLAFPGWHMVMSPEGAARGMELMQWIMDYNICPPDAYQDLSQYDWWKEKK